VPLVIARIRGDIQGGIGVGTVLREDGTLDKVQIQGIGEQIVYEKNGDTLFRTVLSDAAAPQGSQILWRGVSDWGCRIEPGTALVELSVTYSRRAVPRSPLPGMPVDRGAILPAAHPEDVFTAARRRVGGQLVKRASGGNRGESGYALLTALLVIFLLSIALSLLAASLQLRMRIVREDAETVILSGLSDAAVAEAVANLAASGYYYSGSPEHTFGDGKITSTVEPESPGLYNVVATATYAGRKRAVEVEIFRAPGVARVRRWRRLAS